MCRFIDCLEDNSLAALVIEGDPDHADLAEAWFNIQLQFAEQTNDKEMKRTLQAKANVLHLQVKIQQVQILTDTLENFYVAEFHQAANRLFREKFALDAGDPDGYAKDIARMRKLATNYELELKMETNRLQALQIRTAKSEEGSVPTREYFLAMKVHLSNFFKRDISFDISVFEYCELLKAAKQQAAETKKQLNGK